LYTNIDQTLVNSLHRLLNCEIGGLRFVVLLQQSIEHVSIVYTCNTYFVTASVHVIYSGVFGQCSHTKDQVRIWRKNNLL